MPEAQPVTRMTGLKVSDFLMFTHHYDMNLQIWVDIFQLETTCLLFYLSLNFKYGAT